MKEIETPITKEIHRFEATDLQSHTSEIEFDKLTTLQHILAHHRIWVLRVARVGPFVTLKSRTDNEGGGFREEGRIAGVVEVVVAPDDGVDGGERERCGCELVSHVFRDVYSRFEIVFYSVNNYETR
jgi:hypothetical protein